MPEFYSQEKLPNVPDDITLEEFTLEHTHTLRPPRPSWAPWLVVDKTGRKVALDEKRTRGLEVGMRDRFGIREDDIGTPCCIAEVSHSDAWRSDAILKKPYRHFTLPSLTGGVLTAASIRLSYLHLGRTQTACDSFIIIRPCNPTFTVSELSHQLKQTKPSLIIADANVLDTALEGAHTLGLGCERIIVLPDEDEKYPNHLTVNELIAEGLALPYSRRTRKLTSGEGRKKTAFLSPSSGTTGLPKIVAISHFAVIANVLMVSTHQLADKKYAGYRPGNVCLGIPPLYHIYGIILMVGKSHIWLGNEIDSSPQLHVPLFCAITLVVVPKFGFKAMLESVERHKVNQLLVVPAQVVMLLKDPDVGRYDLSSIRVIICAGAPLSVELAVQLPELFPHAQIGQAYGQTEATGGITMFSSATKLGVFCGNLLPGILARVIKTDGSLANRGEPGELYVKTPAAASGYWGNEVATRKTFVDGWIRTGDLVLFNTEEELVYIDRLKEIIKVNALQVSPSDLEACLLGHPMVAEACIVGVPHESRGEVPLAFIVLTADAASVSQRINGAQELKMDLMQHVAKNRARYKHLGRVEFIDSIPKNPSGKILRRILQERALRLVGATAKL